VIDSPLSRVILRLSVLSIASEGLYVLLSRESVLPSGRVEETPVFYAVWAALFLVYFLAIRTASRTSGRSVVLIVLLTSAAFRGTLLWKSGFDRSVPHVFLQGPSPLRAGEEAMATGLERAGEWPVDPEALAISLVDLSSLALAPGLLRAASLPVGLVVVHGWNPLLVKEVSGNVRVEAVPLLFLLLSFRLAQKKRPTSAALAYGLSLTGPILGFWATLPLMARVLRLRLVISILVAGALWAPMASSLSWQKLVAWPPSDWIGGSLLPALTTLNRVFLTRNELVSLWIAAAAFLLVALHRTFALRRDWGNLPREALVLSGFSLFLAPQVLPWSFLPIAVLGAFSANPGWALFTATAPLTYVSLPSGSWSFWVGFTQYFPAYATSIFSWLGGESVSKRTKTRADRGKSPGRAG
jgi:hypothetical protein